VTVVFVCQQNPWRLNGGALIRNYWMVRALAREHRVDLVTADDATETVPPDFAADCASISRFGRSAGTLRRVRRVLGALRPWSSYYTSGAVSAAMRRAVKLLAARPDTCVMIDLGVRDALLGTRAPFIFNAHNTEYELQLRRATYISQPARTLLRFEASRTKRLEADFVRRALLTAACSAEDRDELRRLAPSARERIAIVPNGVDVARYAAVAASIPASRTILVTGSFDWQPNVVGLEWFMSDVLPALRARSTALDVRVAGRMSDALAAKLTARGVTAVPRPADMRDELRGARIVLAPILPSSGTRLRILEAWAAGRPVATTASGAFGLRYASGDLLVADDAPGLAAAAIRLLDTEELWTSVRAGGLERAADYDWQTIGERFLTELASALGAQRSRT
jgi:glycosyltransferase involved in cell wall biosynthesis